MAAVSFEYARFDEDKALQVLTNHELRERLFDLARRACYYEGEL